jgi:hypothetical protein
LPWSLKFDDPIKLEGRKTLRTLREAAQYIVELPPRQSALPHWQTAMACLLAAAERKGPVMMARIAVVKALTTDVPEPPSKPRRKRAKANKLVR